MYIAQHQQNLGGGFNAAFDIRHVSDDDYFRDFSTLGLNEASTDLLPSSATLSWNGSEYWAASLQTYTRSEEHTSELQSLMRTSYAVFFLKKKNTDTL